MRQNRSMPASTVIPVLAYPAVPEAVAWLSAAFGFTLRLGIVEIWRGNGWKVDEVTTALRTTAEAQTD